MEEEKKKKDYFVYVILFLFCIFLLLYYSSSHGYYEYKTYKKSILTEDAINEFETDISNGENVLINDYVVNNEQDYSNSFNIVGSKIGLAIEKFMNKGIKKALEVIRHLFFN